MKIHCLPVWTAMVVEITHVKVGPSVFQDELSGIRLVLTVVDVHLELVSLGNKETAACNLRKVWNAVSIPNFAILRKFEHTEGKPDSPWCNGDRFSLRKMEVKVVLPKLQNNVPRLLEAAHISPTPSGKCCTSKDGYLHHYHQIIF